MKVYERTAYFLGAGASKADRFPLTRELLGALGASLFRAGGKRRSGTSELFEFLTTVFRISARDLKEAAKAWERLLATSHADEQTNVLPPDTLPNLTDILSSLDILLSEESTIGAARNSGRALRGSFLARARAQIVRAIAEGFRVLHDRAPVRVEDGDLTVERFVRALGPDDVIVTTNWDILVDKARCERLGATPDDYGTDAHLLNSAASRSRRWQDPVIARLHERGLGRYAELRKKSPRRPKLLKLHGSLNWLHCPRCQVLQINVTKVVAHRARADGAGAASCRCGVPFESVLVTPTFVKSYRNRHLMNVWSTAQRELADVGRWAFIGYSLPDDDIHIKTLLLKARQMRADGNLDLKIIVVGKLNRGLKERYERLFGRCTFQFSGFEKFVEVLERQRRPIEKARIDKAVHDAFERQADDSRKKQVNARRRRSRRRTAARS